MSESRDINWLSVHQRLDNAALLLEEAFSPSEEAVRRTLEERAKKVAAPVAKEESDSHDRTLLLVQVGDHVAGITMGWVREVVPLTHGYAQVPEADEHLLGVINVHNQLVNLISPWPLLNETAPTGMAGFPCAVLLRHPHLKLAIGCDRALQLVSLPDEAWQSDRLFLHQPGEPPGVLLGIPLLVKSWESQEETAPA